ncbi:MAG: cation:proton antiporter [Fimbriimonas ginsengisoli]|uniref:Cation:proton antiporter n=1 Tax=Fimbriimonas ginsengisoli TaxID=1005039 RepID=A0A931LQR0_FIMGI|nr:cation:proton antiporter [Fimbriimonas ginsengisoli]
MEHVWFTAAIWLGLALVATLVALWLRISVALTEIVVGTVAQVVIVSTLGPNLLDAKEGWVTFLAGVGAIMLTFLAGAELDPKAFKSFWKQAVFIGVFSFAAPFLLGTATAFWLLRWDPRAAWLGGVALSTTSVAVVYAVMLELGLNRTQFGKAILAACFVTDLGTVLALGVLFAPFTARTLYFGGGMVLAVPALLYGTRPFFHKYGRRPSELEAKYLLFALFLLGGLAVWSGSEAVLPAYLVGMMLAGTVGTDHQLVRRLRTLTFGLLTPFYFIRAGSLVHLPAIGAAFGAFVLLLLSKMVAKFVGVYPLSRRLGHDNGDAMYLTLLMSTGLTFGTISALYGVSHNIIDQSQYSLLVAAVIASAVIPTWIANRWFLPHRHLPKGRGAEDAAAFATEDE